MNIYSNLNEAFVEELSHLETSGNIVFSRGSKQLERNFTSIVIEDPTQLNIEVPVRKFNKNYAVAEWLWYVSTNPKVNNISKLASIWEDISDSFDEAESNYGSYIFSQNHGENSSQWDWVIEELVNDPDSRRATIVINQPYHKGKNPKDYPCTHYIHFFVRGGKLDMGISMRSNDAIFGFCNDVFTFSLFQQLMLNELNERGMNISLGKYYHHAGSFHVYERHFKMMNTILANYYVKAQKSGYPNTEKFILNSNLTYKKIRSLRCELPTRDMSKEEIFEFVENQKRILFNE